MLIETGEWFTVAGLRRTGKTTLVRSIVHFMHVPNVYVNLWELPNATFGSLMKRLLEESSKILVVY